MLERTDFILKTVGLQYLLNMRKTVLLWQKLWNQSKQMSSLKDLAVT